MRNTKSESIVSLVGVGLPTEYGTLPVTYFYEGTHLTVYVGGLHFPDVSASKDEHVEAEEWFAKHALAVVEEIAAHWNDFEAAASGVRCSSRTRKRPELKATHE